MATLSGRANEKRHAKLLNMQMSFAFSQELLNGFSPVLLSGLRSYKSTIWIQFIDILTHEESHANGISGGQVKWAILAAVENFWAHE